MAGTSVIDAHRAVRMSPAVGRDQARPSIRTRVDFAAAGRSDDGEETRPRGCPGKRRGPPLCSHPERSAEAVQGEKRRDVTHSDKDTRPSSCGTGRGSRIMPCRLGRVSKLLSLVRAWRLRRCRTGGRSPATISNSTALAMRSSNSSHCSASSCSLAEVGHDRRAGTSALTGCRLPLPLATITAGSGVGDPLQKVEAPRASWSGIGHRRVQLDPVDPALAVGGPAVRA